MVSEIPEAKTNTSAGAGPGGMGGMY